MMEAFSYKSEVAYKAGAAYPRQLKAVNLTDLLIVVGLNEVFYTKVADIWQKYLLPPIEAAAVQQAWNNTPMQFWQNQLNFAVWCATSGCCVSFNDHLNGKRVQNEPLMQSVFIFHIYYTIRRILNEMQIPLPQDNSFNPFSNTYDRRVYERICVEFGVSPMTDWRQKSFSNSNGLGDVYTKGHSTRARTSMADHKKILSADVGNLDPSKMS